MLHSAFASSTKCQEWQQQRCQVSSVYWILCNTKLACPIIISPHPPIDNKGLEPMILGPEKQSEWIKLRDKQQSRQKVCPKIRILEIATEKERRWAGILWHSWFKLLYDSLNPYQSASSSTSCTASELPPCLLMLLGKEQQMDKELRLLPPCWRLNGVPGSWL